MTTSVLSPSVQEEDRVRIRPLAEGDGLALIELQQECAAALPPRRPAPPLLRPRAVESLVRPSSPQRAALGALAGDRLLGVGAWTRVRAQDRAELHLLVGAGDGAARGAVAVTLVRALAASAAPHGVRRLLHRSLPSEASVREVFARAGFETATVYQEGQLLVSFATRPQ